MNIVSAIKNYVDKMIRDSEPGYKIMLMDKETTAIISIVLSMSEVMKQEVYMFERIDQTNNSENMSYLKCLVFIRPTSENISLLCRELQSPRYGSYYIYFSNVVNKSDVKLLAEADEQEVVKEVQEVYADYLALSPHFFSLNTASPIIGLKWHDGALLRAVHGITALLFSLQLFPLIRYQQNSELTKLLAENVKQTLVTEGSLYSNQDSETSCVLLILDRREDSVTPLLHQWTYEAMVHDLLSISNGRVNLSHISGISDELKEVIMSPTQDEFYARTMYLNYGDIGQTIKELMEEYQRKVSKQQKVESIADMKNFVETYPQFRKMSGTVSKHVTVVGELSRQVSNYILFEISECQQLLVCDSDHSSILQRIYKLITNPKVREVDATILVLLYALKHENHPKNEVSGLLNALRKRNVSPKYLKLLSSILEYGGTHFRRSDLFDAKLPQDVSAIKKKILKGLKGVENVYTQHKPLLSEILDDVAKGKLKEAVFPQYGRGPAAQSQIRAVVVFIVGGATCEESFAVHKFNVENPSVKAVLGGTGVLNTEGFLKTVETAMEGVYKGRFRI